MSHRDPGAPSMPNALRGSRRLVAVGVGVLTTALAVQAMVVNASAEPSPTPTPSPTSESSSDTAADPTPSATLPSRFVYRPTDADAAMATSISQVRAKVMSLQMQASAIGEQANSFAITVAAQQKKVTARSAAVTAQTRVVAAKQRAISSLVLASIQQGGTGPGASFLTSKNPAAVLQQGATTQSVTDQQAGALQALQNAKAGLADLQAGERSELAALKQAQAKQAAKKKDADAKVAEANALLASLNKQQKMQMAVEARRQRLAEMRAATAAAASAARAQAAAARAATTATGDVPAGLPPAPSSGAAAAIRFAIAQMGKPYVWGAAGPNSYDCSGLTMMAWRAGGVSLPHQSGQQYGSSPRVATSAMQPGDLVFYYTPISHVAIYIGNGQIVHAPHPGAPVRSAPVASMPIVGVTRP